MKLLNIAPSTLFRHDNLAVLRGINTECIDLIYLDPPFNKKKTFTAPEKSAARGAAFRDRFSEDDIQEEWLEFIEGENPSLHKFLNVVENMSGRYNHCYSIYMAIRLMECRRTLKQTGSIYLHCDPTMSHFLKLVMDCIFGEENFINEIVWGYPPGGRGPRLGFHRKHDILLLYAKSARQVIFQRPYTRITERAATKFTKTDGNGRKYKEYPGGISYLDESPGRPVPDWWVDINSLGQTISRESTGYPTQKPLALLERIIQASSRKGGIVLDPFCGCATTCIAAEKLGRQWIGIDVSRKSFELLGIRLKSEVPPEMHHSEPILRTSPPKRSDSDEARENLVYIPPHENFIVSRKSRISSTTGSRAGTSGHWGIGMSSKLKHGSA